MKFNLILISCGFLVACGGSGGGSGEVNGKVADGYLSGAVVCADTTGDKACDDETLKTTSTKGGVFTLPKEARNYPIIAEVLATTIDEDTGKAIGSDTYTLSAPRGKTFISPITTMMQSKIDANPTISADDAAILVKNNLCITDIEPDILYNDYAATGNKDSDIYKKIYQTAQVIARIMGDIETILKARLNFLGETDDTKKIIQTVIDTTVEELAKDLCNQAVNYIDQGSVVSADKADEIATANQNMIDQVDDEFSDRAEVKRRIDNANNNELNVIKSAKDFLREESVVYGYIDDTTYFIDALTLDGNQNNAIYSDDSDNDEFDDYFSLNEEQIIAKLRENNKKWRTLTISADNSSVELIEHNDKIVINQIAKRSIAGLILNCNEIIIDYEYNNICDGFTGETITFAEGDFRYYFNYQIFPRFKKSTVVEKLTTLTLEEFCPIIKYISGGIVNNVNCFEYVDNNNDYYYSVFNSLENPVAGKYIDNSNNFSYFWANDALSIEGCLDKNYDKICDNSKQNIGKPFFSTLSSGEKVWIYPSIDTEDGGIAYDMILRNYKYFGFIYSEDHKVSSFSSFNLSAYKNINKFFIIQRPPN